MSTPPFIAMPDGVAALAPPASPAPVLVAESRAGGSGEEPGTGGSDQVSGGLAGTGQPATRAGGAEEPTASPSRDVLLVPGFTGSKEDYIAVLRPLADRGWRVAAMDLPGQGGFAGLGPRGTHTPEALASAVAEVAQWLAPGRRVHLVAHSAGGLVAREFVLRHPDRVASWTPICSGPAAVPGQAFAKLIQLQAAIAALPMEQVWALKEASDRSEGWVPPSEEVAEFCARRFAANDPAALADFADILMTTPDRTDDLAQAMRVRRIGGAVLTGARDDAWPLAEQEQMATRLGVPWRVLPEVGHNPSTEAPEATVALLDDAFRTAV